MTTHNECMAMLDELFDGNQSALARDAGFTVQTIGNYTSGRREPSQLMMRYLQLLKESRVEPPEAAPIPAPPIPEPSREAELGAAVRELVDRFCAR